MLSGRDKRVPGGAPGGVKNTLLAASSLLLRHSPATRAAAARSGRTRQAGPPGGAPVRQRDLPGGRGQLDPPLARLAGGLPAGVPPRRLQGLRSGRRVRRHHIRRHPPPAPNRNRPLRGVLAAVQHRQSFELVREADRDPMLSGRNSSAELLRLAFELPVDGRLCRLPFHPRTRLSSSGSDPGGRLPLSGVARITYSAVAGNRWIT